MTDPRELLRRLLKLMPRLWGTDSEQEVLPALLETMLAVFEAEWAALVELPSEARQPVLLHTRGARTGGAPESISRTVLERLRTSGKPLLVSDIELDPTLMAAASIPMTVRSILAAPLEGVEGPERLVYLESPTSRKSYSQDEQELLLEMCRFAAEHLRRAGEARGHAQARQRLGQLPLAGEAADQASCGLVGRSQALQEVAAQVRQVAATDVTVMITGESGTGKEVAAHAIHLASGRRDQPFVPVNCMALPDDLVESELFGHARGAFTGAAADYMGRFEMAHGGTLFLDEFGELSPKVQVKLLRVLETGSIRRLGEGRERKIDVRLVTATNADLAALIKEGKFREDLYYRISVFSIRMPALRERPDDLEPLAAHFIALFNQKHRRNLRGLRPEALEAMRRHAWPGNVRELRNVIEQAFVREVGIEIGVEALSLRPAPSASRTEVAPEPPEAFEAAKAAWERRHILRVLEKAGGRIAAAAERLAMSRGNLYKKLYQHGIDPTAFR